MESQTQESVAGGSPAEVPNDPGFKTVPESIAASCAQAAVDSFPYLPKHKATLA